MCNEPANSFRSGNSVPSSNSLRTIPSSTTPGTSSRGRAPGAAALDGRDGVEVTIVEPGPLVGRVRVTRTFGPSTSVVTYQLRADSAQLDIDIELDWHHDEHLLSMAFPLDVRADVAMCDVQFGVVARPTHASSPWDAAKFEVCAHRFVDLAEPDFGVAVLNAGRFGHSVFDGAIPCEPRPRGDVPRSERRPWSP